MPHERSARQVLLAKLKGKRPRGRPRTRRSDYISDLVWSRLGVGLAEVSEIALNRAVFRVLVGLLLPRPSWEEKHVWKWMKRMNVLNVALYKIVCRFACTNAWLKVLEDGSGAHWKERRVAYNVKARSLFLEQNATTRMCRLPHQYVCDGINHCGDHSDECSAGCRSKNKRFECGNRQ